MIEPIGSLAFRLSKRLEEFSKRRGARQEKIRFHMSWCVSEWAPPTHLSQGLLISPLVNVLLQT